MPTMPRFLNISPTPNSGNDGDHPHRFAEYKPLLGIWLIDLCLSLKWVDQFAPDALEAVFCDDDFITITGLSTLRQLVGITPGKRAKELEDEIGNKMWIEMGLPEMVEKPVAALPTSIKRARKRNPAKNPDTQKAAIITLLKNRRQELLAQGVNADLPLFQNIERVGRMLHLNDAEKAVLSFAAALSCFPILRGAIMPTCTKINDAEMARIVAQLTGHPENAVRIALRRDSVLLTSGLVRFKHDEDDFEDKIDLARALRSVMLDNLASDEDLSRRVLIPASPGSLSLADFPHLQHDIELLCAYLKGVIQTNTPGANVLFYGPPGTGKTELVKALCQQLGLTLYEIGYADEDGDPIDGEQRLRSLNFCQRALHGKHQVALLFDEVEDVLPGNPGKNPFGQLFAPAEAKGGKAWINRSLEENAVPTLWVTNNADIDPAYLRRFDYSLGLRIPPHSVRSRIAHAQLGQHAPDAARIAALAELDDLVPAQLERAARLARLAALNAPDQAWRFAETAIHRSRALLGQGKASLKARPATHYALDYLNTDADIPALIHSLTQRPQASLALYGPPGTGKSQLARHIARQLGKPLLIKRASDILDKYLGESEKHIAAMFQQALDEDAVLLLDEADSFLRDRQGAQRSWEVSQTNEMLTQLECFDGLFFATTNLMDSLDPACLRRFSHKIKFDYLKPDQSWAMFDSEARRLGLAPATITSLESRVRQLHHITPGDFAVVLREIEQRANPTTAEHLLAQLEKESRTKQHGKRPIGF